MLLNIIIGGGLLWVVVYLITHTKPPKDGYDAYHDKFAKPDEPPRAYKDTPSPQRSSSEVVAEVVAHSKAKEHAVEAPSQNRGKHSTRNAVIITSIGVVAFVIIGNLSTPQPAPTPPIYVQRYSSDQVIAVARYQYPICFKGNTLVQAPTEISVLYMGGTNHAWHVSIRTPDGYHWVEWSPDGVEYYVYTQKTVYFWETDGALHSSQYY